MLEKIKSILVKKEVPPPWFLIAEREIGVKEVRGGENPRILEYFKYTTLKATEDEVSWCSAFMNFCVAKSGSNGVNYERSHSAAERSWLGVADRIKGYKKYAIVIFKRGNSAWQGHVAIAVEDLGTHLRVLGGNQGDMVCYKVMPKANVLGYVWPRPEPIKVIRAA